MSTTLATKRLLIDLKRLQKDPPAGISAAPTEDDFFVWKAVIFGPDDTPFEDGVFKLSIEFPKDYPSRPPTVRFTTKIFHPNIFSDGRICLDILDNKWSPTYDVYSLLLSIQSLLNDPNPSSPANSIAAQLYTADRREYEKRVKACVEESLSLLKDPNPSSPANSIAAQLYTADRREYEKRVKACVERK